MTTKLTGSQEISAEPELERGEKLSPAARRALAEAAARRAAAAQSAPSDEIGGRAGLEPTRYGDWERNGLASDF
ncbi:DUF1674 domain-containing protein [Methylocystis bryophila]|uniref:DUF1674 domain-containing protein n=1 Tax=Methylocystis bryophila TaxID=655015 RepID=A0A1W6MV65_9HYPH|nr:DUF1674 domain-containing protein [Methylocystis bryophila]ARN81406.1 hypothetical protein B1812_10335 [Methylocystis bryophila]BDV37403.1 hypothetical protein DSM21852_06560 [Methylocystis bryophila]